MLKHWPEYLIEGALLGLFMLSACFFTALLEYPGSPAASLGLSGFTRRALIGAAMGFTAIVLIYSPWGKRSGAHMNPAVTITFFRLGKIAKRDAAFYMIFQFVGGAASVLLAAAAFRRVLADPSVQYVVTVPGRAGVGIAFIAEFVISCLLMFVILWATNTRRVARFTGLFAGLLVALYITFEAPLSGMSINPARTFASAVAALDWAAIWIYFVAPPIGMLLAADIYVRWRGMERVGCAKLHHQNHHCCIFCEHHRGSLVWDGKKHANPRRSSTSSHRS
jgi:aquaporin Z